MVPDQILIGSSKGLPDTAKPHPLKVVRAFGPKNTAMMVPGLQANSRSRRHFVQGFFDG
jgi:hypothetical protein